MELENIILSSIFISGIIELIIKYFIRNRNESKKTNPPNVLNNLFFISITQSHFTVFKIIFLLNILYLSTK
ncbi:Uncharacterised protein [Yersinia pseudotuberculosis]|nr:putative membrane protein [Yersinia pseudotuberculosis str. PA3606]CNH63012.1 Uncharacterised protein [Yersinia pseudotuberculosis]CNH98269.1 Uncharacterised protein [Yersinia pseudotuberculosis]CRY72771.1 Uncharacterised protein [Yersinia pseudotuberculosis]